ncbi:MAG: hypothetical protein FWG03_05120 [Clostridiales bacterium]|nr:hypothetical protein [Clostridiales bacterium]
MGFEKQTEEIREICARLFSEGRVDAIVAHMDGGLDGTLIPFIAKGEGDIAKIVWGDRIRQNLAPYLHGRTDRVGIVAMPCDARAIVQYINESQLVRENVYIIGVDCPGMVDEDGSDRPGCAECAVRCAPVCDERVAGDPAGPAGDPDGAAGGLRPTAGEAVAPAEKFARFRQEIDKCILCYSCRQACYACYCKTCFIDRDMPDWQPAELDAGTKMTFHLGRAMHLAGRCVECGACEAACASGVNVRYIIKEVTDFVDDMYGFRTGMDIGTAQAMVVYGLDDREQGFLGEAQHE